MAKRQLLRALTIVLSTLAIAGIGSPANAAPTGVIKVWSPEFMAGTQDVTQTQAVEHAKRFNLIAALKGTYRGYVGAMKAANPNLKLIVYMNAAFAQDEDGSAYPASWYARDANGNKIRSNNFGNWLMDISHSGWIRNRGEECKEFLAYSGYDTCWLDMLGTGPLGESYLTAQPINPATGKLWTKPDYIRATTNLAKQVKTYVGKPMYGNGLANGKRYFDPTAPTNMLFNALNGATAELFIRHSTDAITKYRSEAEWKKDVDMLVNAGSRGKSVMTITKVWISATRAQKDAWHEYALASFLLGTNGKSYFSFLYDKTLSAITSGHPWWNINLGSPSGAYGKTGPGYYARTFTSGKVFVNPTTNSYTVSLGGTYIDVNGNRVTSVRLGPHDAAILRKA